MMIINIVSIDYCGIIKQNAARILSCGFIMEVNVDDPGVEWIHFYS